MSGATKDNQLYARFALRFAGHPKILPLSDKAFRCLVEAILHCREHESDGLLDRRYAVARWGLETLTELTQNDPEKPSLSEVEKGWLVHDYSDMNETKAEIEARRERNKRAGQIGGLAKAKRRASESLGKVLSENVAEIEIEKEIDGYVGGSLTLGRPQKSTRRRGTRLPEGWMPREATVASIRAEHPHVTSDQLTVQHKQFADWAAACSTQAAVKLDWDAAWRRWMRQELPKMPTATNGHGHAHGPSKLRTLVQLAAQADTATPTPLELL